MRSLNYSYPTAMKSQIEAFLDPLLPPGVRLAFSQAHESKPNSDLDKGSAIVLYTDSPARLFRCRTLSDFAEAYVNGAFDIQGSAADVIPIIDTLGQFLRDRRDGDIDNEPEDQSSADDSDRFARPEKEELISAQVGFHYDKDPSFWELWLDPLFQYTCAYYLSDDDTLEDAQIRKLKLIGRKLALSESDRLLDFGCGWGGWLQFAIDNWGVHSTGITLSKNQAVNARGRLRKYIEGNQCSIEVCDFRNAKHLGNFHKVTGIGILEHAGLELAPDYFHSAWNCLLAGGLFLNQSIAWAGRPPINRRNDFVDAYIFPGGELLSIDETINHANAAGFEILDVESMRDSYTHTSREWLRRLEDNEAAIVDLVGQRSYRIFRLYLAGFFRRFSTGAITVFQTLMRKPNRNCEITMENRHDWYRDL